MVRMSGQTRVLVVDDEPIVREVLSRYLARGGFAVETAEDGERALEAYETWDPDLVVLDLMLPQVDGLEVFRRIRSRAPTPVIMLTAKGQEGDRLAGLEIGADDFIVKPFSPREVVARVRTVLRRAGPATSPGKPIRFGELEIDGRSRQVRVGAREVTLTPKEFDLLLFLASHPGEVFGRVEILEELWDFAFDGDPSTVTVHVRRLREKIEEDPAEPRHLITVWGVGYRFDS
jgi:two-component system, OmpR family, response regulator ResD